MTCSSIKHSTYEPVALPCGTVATNIHPEHSIHTTDTEQAERKGDRTSIGRWLPSFSQFNHQIWLNRQIWLHAVGRGLYQAVVAGIVLFHAPILFVNHFGLSATAVGFGVASGSLTGILANIIGGTLTDHEQFGRKGTLFLGFGLAALSCVVLTFAHTLPLFIGANLLANLSLGLYWISSDTAVMDATSLENRHHGFAILGVADALGFGLGILGGGVLLRGVDRVELLFAIGSVLLLMFLGFIRIGGVETRTEPLEKQEATMGWRIALQDRLLLTFLGVNCFFTTYIALVSITLPLYLTNFIGSQNTSPDKVSMLFALFYIGLSAILQVPIVSVIGKAGAVRALMLSLGIWGGGFLFVWSMGSFVATPLPIVIVALSLLGIATVIYKPFASTLLSEIAPEASRGIYTSMAYQCYPIGYFIAPLMGGWALDQSQTFAHHAWMAVVLSAIGGFLLLGAIAHQHVSTVNSPDIV